MPSLGGFPSEYRHPVWYGKTRMVWLPDGEKILKISLFVLTECTNVTDRHTDTTWRQAALMHSIARHKQFVHFQNITVTSSVMGRQMDEGTRKNHYASSPFPT